MTKPKVQGVFFDFDGVLLNSIPTMEDSWTQVQQKFDIDVPFRDYLIHVGKPFPRIMEILGLGDRKEEIRTLYFENSRTTSVRPQVYQYVLDTLKEIKGRGVKIGMITSKPSITTYPLLKEFELEEYFDDIQCPDGKPASFGKPNPFYLLTGISNTNCEPTTSIYVGDMPSDWETARRGGVPYLHADWGYGHLDPEIQTVRLKNMLEILYYVN